MMGNGFSFEIDKKFNTIMELNVIRSLAHTSKLEVLALFITNDEIDNIKFRQGNIDVEVTPEKTFINGIRVGKGKLFTILTRIKNDEVEDMTKQIKLLNKLGVTKMKFLELNELEIGDIMIPFEIDVVNKDLFTLTIKDMSTNIEWSKVKDYFSLSHTRVNGYLNYTTFKNIMINEFDMNKKEIFSMLKDYKLVNDL